MQQPISNNKTCTERKFQIVGWIHWNFFPFFHFTIPPWLQHISGFLIIKFLLLCRFCLEEERSKKYYLKFLYLTLFFFPPPSPLTSLLIQAFHCKEEQESHVLLMKLLLCLLLPWGRLGFCRRRNWKRQKEQPSGSALPKDVPSFSLMNPICPPHPHPHPLSNPAQCRPRSRHFLSSHVFCLSHNFQVFSFRT